MTFFLCFEDHHPVKVLAGVEEDSCGVRDKMRKLETREQTSFCQESCSLCVFFGYFYVVFLNWSKFGVLQHASSTHKQAVMIVHHYCLLWTLQHNALGKHYAVLQPANNTIISYWLFYIIQCTERTLWSTARKQDRTVQNTDPGKQGQGKAVLLNTQQCSTNEPSAPF